MHDDVSIHVSVDVPELGRGLAFYGAVFGLTETARPFPTMAILDGGSLTICMHEKPAGTESSRGSGALRGYERHWTPVHLDFHVPTLGPVVAAIEAAGGRVEQTFGGRRPVAFCSDPFGNGFCVIANLAG